MKRSPRALRGAVLLALGGACAAPAQEAPPKRLRVRVVRSFAHDPGAFTQGLVFDGGVLYESTGMYGQSTLRKVDPDTGAVLAKVAVEPRLFAEGLALAGGRFYQLTWREGRALVWNPSTLKIEKELPYTGEGWGLCFDGTHLVMSDGTDRLVRRDPKTFAAVGEVRVRSEGVPVSELNELECVEGTIYANVWMRSSIARIDARSGRVTAWIDASGLLRPEEERAADVLNGIAYRPDTGRFIITGKNWPRAFEVVFE
jgi:glutaminyl-peptide cyclotransferase